MIGLLGNFIYLAGQDVHYSHIHASPISLNPSLAGLFDGDIRVISNLRQQWHSVPVGYKTGAISVDMNVLPLGRYDFLGAGLQVEADQAGDLDLTQSKISLSSNIVKALDRRGEHYISMGIQASWVNQSIDLSKAIVLDVEEALVEGERLAYFDVSTGFSWFYRNRSGGMFYLGSSLFHATKPDVSLYSLIGTGQLSLFERFVLHGGLETGAKDGMKLMPSFIYMRQGPFEEFTAGTFMRFALERHKRKSYYQKGFYWGLWGRSHLINTDKIGLDALILSIRLDYKNVAYTFSYDINVSDFSFATNYRGGPEISIIWFGEIARKKRRRTSLPCPKF